MKSSVFLFMDLSIKQITAFDHSLWIKTVKEIFELDAQDCCELPDLLRASNTIAFMATVKQNPVGSALVCIHQNNSASLHFLGVLPAYQRQGIGTQLLKKCTELAKQQGATEITFTAADQAIPLYDKNLSIQEA